MMVPRLEIAYDRNDRGVLFFFWNLCPVHWGRGRVITLAYQRGGWVAGARVARTCCRLSAASWTALSSDRDTIGGGGMGGGTGGTEGKHPLTTALIWLIQSFLLLKCISVASGGKTSARNPSPGIAKWTPPFVIVFRTYNPRGALIVHRMCHGPCSMGMYSPCVCLTAAAAAAISPTRCMAGGGGERTDGPPLKGVSRKATAVGCGLPERINPYSSKTSTGPQNLWRWVPEARDHCRPRRPRRRTSRVATGQCGPPPPRPPPPRALSPPPAPAPPTMGPRRPRGHQPQGPAPDHRRPPPPGRGTYKRQTHTGVDKPSRRSAGQVFGSVLSIQQLLLRPAQILRFVRCVMLHSHPGRWGIPPLRWKGAPTPDQAPCGGHPPGHPRDVSN